MSGTRVIRDKSFVHGYLADCVSMYSKANLSFVHPKLFIVGVISGTWIRYKSAIYWWKFRCLWCNISIHDAGSGSPKIFPVHLFSFSLFSSMDPFRPSLQNFLRCFSCGSLPKSSCQRPSTEYANTFINFFCFNQRGESSFDAAMVFWDDKSDIERLHDVSSLASH